MSGLNSLAKVAAGAEKLETKLEALARVSVQMQNAATAAAEQAAKQAAVANSMKHGSLGARYHATERRRRNGPPAGKYGGGRRTKRSKRSKRTRRR